MIESIHGLQNYLALTLELLYSVALLCVALSYRIPIGWIEVFSYNLEKYEKFQRVLILLSGILSSLGNLTEHWQISR